MNCKDVSARASSFVDSELGFVERAQLRAHLFICKHCRRYVNQLSATIAVVRGRQWVAPDEDAEERAVALLHKRPPPADGTSPFNCS
jgi:anti-sigma factor RsiW